MKATPAKLIRKIAQQLYSEYADESICHQYAWWILEALTRKKKSALLSATTITLTQTEWETLQKWITQITQQHMPLQYILAEVPFGPCSISVEPPILIPRPETEEWVLNVCESIAQYPAPRILDLCTGSGCIAIAVKKLVPTATVSALDISLDALALAKKNATRNDVAIDFYHSDLFSSLPPEASFDFILSNPPYISATEYEALSPSVKNWEDKKALYADMDGLAIIAEIIAQAPHFMRRTKNQPSYLFIEIGHTQGPAVAALFKKAGFNDIKIHKDLYGQDRVVSGSIIHERTA